jgi:acyl transferase domain-containing protein/NADPH:quinone reductase-like Zn-dependent oxidoreductase
MSQESAGTAPPADGGGLSPLKRAFLALEDAQARLAAAERAVLEPVAIIGVGCRAPGADGPDALWELLREGRDAIGPIPPDRFDAGAYYDSDAGRPGKINTRSGGFLSDVVGFDAGFFQIAPREAQGMDPQQRLLLEVAWEAFENAGQAPDKLEGSATGVYVGVTGSDYAYLQLRAGDPGLFDAHYTSGIAHSVASGRLSYLLGLQGPAVTFDTACSSSLVAVHHACLALRARDCRMAIAGGVNVILSPDLYVALSRSLMLSPDGRCKAFAATADGFARGEGCGLVVLKRLSDAEADGDRILAVLRGSAVNQDGPSSSLTAPNGPAQEAVVREALQRAGVNPGDVSYLEAHGTGTQLGDPLEAQALGNVFGPGRDPARPLWLGSVKTNLGHLEGAAGITGLLKLVLSLRARQIPPHLHFTTPSPHIPWAQLPLRVLTELTPWEPINGRRIAGVSAFGFSGTNAHVVVEEAPAPFDAPPAEHRAVLYVCSARDGVALAQLAGRHAAAVAQSGDATLADLAHTAAVGRAQLTHRATVVARTKDELQERLAAVAEEREAEGVRTGQVSRRDPPRIAFLFTGQGAQYAGMARGLYATSPVFRAALDKCAALLVPHLPRPLLEVIFPPEGQTAPIDETAFTQPALFSVEVALAELWRSWGIVPAVVMGHSVGELAAAHVAGVISLEEACRLVAARGRLMQSLPAGGAMAAIFAPEDEVASAVAPYRAAVAIAAVNAPGQTVISGRAAEVEAIGRSFAGRRVRVQPLTVSHAFHSPLVDPILDAFEGEAASVRLTAPRLRLISNLTGQLAEAGQVTTPSYWRRHVREAVRFGDGLKALAALKPDVLLEIGPHPTLLSFAKTAFGETAPLLVPSLRKGRVDWEQMLDTVSSLWLAGADLNWRTLEEGARGRTTDLPTYPFQRERFWFQAATAISVPRGRDTGHPLLGTELRFAGAERVYELRATLATPAFLRHHRVSGRVVMPAAAYLETLLAAAQDATGQERVTAEDVTIGRAMTFGEEEARTVQVVCGPIGDSAITASIASLSESAPEAEAWTRHVDARLHGGATAAEGLSIDAARARCTSSVDPAELHEVLLQRGVDLGAPFRVVKSCLVGGDDVLGELELSAEGAREAGAYRMHPMLIDGCLQLLTPLLAREGDSLFLPVGVARFALHRSVGPRCFCHAVLKPSGRVSKRADLRVFGEDGQLVAELEGFHLHRVARNVLEESEAKWLAENAFEPIWRPASTPAQGPAPSELAATAERALDGLCGAAGLAEYEELLPSLEGACSDLTVRCLRRLGWEPMAGEEVRARALADRLKVLPRHHRLFSRLLAILTEGGWLSRRGDAFVVARPLVDLEPDDALAQLARTHSSGSAEIEMTRRAGAELAEALRGERDPLQLLFPGGSLDTSERMYRDSPTARIFNGLQAEVMAAVALAEAQGRTLRILEVGAGTGGTTAHVLPRLRGRAVEYTFTDVGPLFVEKARDRWGREYPFVRFSVLDLESEPDPARFPPGSFDVIVASNVIHATAELRVTLKRLRGLLAPRGLLAMLEVTAPQRWFDLTVGLTEGWWAFKDTDLRLDYPTLPRDRWLSLLQECGFEGAAALPSGSRTGVLGLQSLFLARRADAMPQACHVVLVTDRGGMAEALAHKLRARGDRATVVADHGALDLAAARAGGGPVDAVVYAAALDDTPWLETISDALDRAEAAGPAGALRVAQALLTENPPPRLWMLTRGAQQALASEALASPLQAEVWGLARTLRLEHPELRASCIDLDPGSGPGELDAVVRAVVEGGVEPELSLRGEAKHVSRLVRLRGRREEKPDGPYRLGMARGDIDGLRIEPIERRAPGEGEVEIEVEATGLNFKDVLNLLGMYPGDPGPLGGECAGRIVAVGPGVTAFQIGDDVIAVQGGSFASHVVARAHLVAPRPEGVGPEEGASFAIAFMTAEFCLGHVARLKRGERVLVHAAAGGVGMAAVRLAQRAGAIVFATAGAAWKRELLRGMGVEHVLDSRSTSFADEILAQTGGAGVDVVLNSLSGDAIEASFRVLARAGRFVEMGKRDIKDAAWVAALGRDIAYTVVDWGETADKDPALVGGLLARLVEELRTGALVPLPRHTFPLSEAARAFRFMAQARHAGKIVIRHGPGAAPVVRRDGTYLVTGGTAGLGLVVGHWLAERGAGRIVLVGRRGLTPEVAAAAESMRAKGPQVLVEGLDVVDEGGLGALLQRLRASGPPLRGVIHGAGLLDDAAVLQQNEERMAKVLAPKVRGGWLLDRLTRADPLDWFVLFASVAGVLGSRGQANHSSANAFLDALARERKARGLPALSIDWGAWSEVGAVADRGLERRLAERGLGAITTAHGIAALEQLIASGAAQAAVVPVEWPKFLGAGSTPPFFTDVAGAPPEGGASPGVRVPRAVAGPSSNLRAQLATVPPGRWRKLVDEFVRERALRALGLDPSRTIDPRRPLGELGLDSLLAVELRNTLGTALGHSFPATLLFDHPTVDSLTDHILESVLGAGPAAAEPEAAPENTAPATMAASIGELSDEEVERQLAVRAARKGRR